MDIFELIFHENVFISFQNQQQDKEARQQGKAGQDRKTENGIMKSSNNYCENNYNIY